MSDKNIEVLQTHLDHWKRLLAEGICDKTEGEESIEAFQAAIEVLKEPCEQIKWERDTALAQLKELGYGLGEKIQPIDTLKIDGMLEDAYEHGYQQARYDYDVQPCEDAVSREAVLDGVDRYIYKSQSTGTQDDFYSFAELVVKALPPVTPKPGTGKWIPLIWDGITSNFPDEMDGHWALFTDGKSISAERAKKDAYDHFLPSGRWFEMSDAIAWMPLPEPYKEGVSE